VGGVFNNWYQMGVPSTHFNHWKVDHGEMGGHMALFAIEAPLFDGTNYSSWGENMK
jgi:hypothetical protein